MFELPSLSTRIAIGKMVGLLIGLCSFVMMPLVDPETGEQARWGILLWYPTMGAMIALSEQFEAEGGFFMPINWWLRGLMIGGWLNLLVALIAGDLVGGILAGIFGSASPLASPYWFAAMGAFAGLAIAYVIRIICGEARSVADG